MILVAIIARLAVLYLAGNFATSETVLLIAKLVAAVRPEDIAKVWPWVQDAAHQIGAYLEEHETTSRDEAAQWWADAYGVEHPIRGAEVAQEGPTE